MTAYCYTPFKLATSIRVLQVLPHTDDRPISTLPLQEDEAPIECKLLEYNLRDLSVTSDPYEALSYVWGSAECPMNILVDGRTLSVTRNLHAALTRLRYRTCARMLWVDAICIDQSNETEKEQQIQLMTEIYARSARVLVWLGKAEGTGEATLEVIREVGERSLMRAKSSESRTESDPLTDEPNIRRLLRRTWFRRIWVLQEVAVARSITVLFGAAEIDGQAFCIGLDEVSRLVGVEIPRVTFLMKNTMFRSRHFRDSKSIVPHSFSLEELLDMYHDRQASRVHDKVYALTRMCSDDLEDAGLEPNYAIPWSILFRRVLQHLLGNMKVTTWDDRQTAMIAGNGRVIGWVSQVENEVGPLSGQVIGAVFRNTKLLPNSEEWRRTARWSLGMYSSAVREGDIICLLENRSLPTIMRWREDHFAIVVIAAAPPTELTSSGTSEPWETLPRSTFANHEIFTFWSWEAMGDADETIKEILEDYKNNMRSKEELMDHAARVWQTGLILERLSQYELAQDQRLCAIKTFEAATGATYEYLLKDQHGLTAMCWAAACGYESLLDALAAHDENEIDRQDDFRGLTPLAWAARNGHTVVIENLLTRGDSDINSRNIYGRTPLCHAVCHGQLEAVEILLQHPNIDVDAADHVDQKTPYIWAAELGHKPIVELLLGTEKINTKAKDIAFGRDALMWAVIGGNVDVVNLLLERGQAETEASSIAKDLSPDSLNTEMEGFQLVETSPGGSKSPISMPWPTDLSGSTLLIYASIFGHHEVVTRLLQESRCDIEAKNADGQTALLLAAENGRTETVKILMDASANVNAADNVGFTPLIWASSEGHTEVAKRLLQVADLDVTADNWHKRTALSWAAGKGHLAIVQEFLSLKHLDVNSKCKHGFTPFSWAARNGHDEIVLAMLKDDRVDINSTSTGSGKTPLMLAIECKHIGTAQILLATGRVAVNVRSTDGDTALSIAARLTGCAGLVKALLEAGSDVNSRCGNAGMTALAWAIQLNRISVVRALLEADGIDVNIIDKQGRPALGLANGMGFCEIAELLKAHGAV